MSVLTSISGNVAVVSGGAAGIGLACAERFAAEGARVAIIDRDKESAHAATEQIISKGGEAICAIGECTSEADMRRVAEEIEQCFGRIDILTNCAGGFRSVQSIEDLDADSFRAGVEWNLTGIYIPMRAVVGAMKANGYGRIVNIGSGAGRTGLVATAIDYSAAKAAVAGLSRRLACELAPHGITVNTIMPGPVMTPRFAEMGEGRAEQLIRAIPAGRLGTSEEIAHAVWYLSTPGAGFTNGATLDVNGAIWTG